MTRTDHVNRESNIRLTIWLVTHLAKMVKIVEVLAVIVQLAVLTLDILSGQGSPDQASLRLAGPKN